ncbi:aminotransferase class V-fold PLP-dependent enzyme [Pseudonocardiaceae bacterium YIM PH 21723]|nr:aminotransferase class V-fold PLP-dependent enzyme [Pseudonocardiaceae bacterium YIM PH 21723]
MITDAHPGEPEEFRRLFPAYEHTRVLDEARRTDYTYLDVQNHLYLDYAGAGLAARRQQTAHLERVQNMVLGNPHSQNPTSLAATELVEQARTRILEYLQADPDEYAVIFTGNATGAARLVGESYPFTRRRRLVLTADNHNSINGIREFARRKNAATTYAAITGPDLRVETEELRSVLRRAGRGLVCFPAQSNFTGVQHPLDWVPMAQEMGYDVLLDAAAYLPTNRLSLATTQPDFLILSWYKIIGYPTGLGCLIARKQALSRLQRPWFSGGTVRASSVGVPWHSLAPDETAFEDGTVNFQGIADIPIGLDWLEDLGPEVIHARVQSLTGWLLHRLTGLRHSDGSPMARIYGPSTIVHRGGTVAFNLLDVSGNIVDERLVARESAAAAISLRTGCVCNPGAGEAALGLTPRDLLPLRDLRTGSLDDYLRLIGLPTAGAIRVSFGLASNASDAERFLAFIEGTYRDRLTDSTGLPARDRC